MSYVPFATLPSGARFVGIDKDGKPKARCMKISNNATPGSGPASVPAAGGGIFDRFVVNAVALDPFEDSGKTIEAGQVMRFEGNEAVLIDTEEDQRARAERMDALLNETITKD